MAEERKKYPVALMLMDEEDKEFTHIDKRGRSPKFYVESLCGEKFFFTSEEAAVTFITEHDMIDVSDEELQEARQKEGYA